jgi:tetratricopeptide (TPR) repeat protein
MLRRLIVVGLLIGAGLAVAAALAYGRWRYHAELDLAKRDMDQKAFAAAAIRLTAVSDRWPEQGEPDYLLGICHEAEGKVAEALADWGRVPEDARDAADAALRRARLALEHGRFALAEECLNRLVQRPGERLDDVEALLYQLFWLTGRTEDARRLLQTQWTRTNREIDILQKLWLLSGTSYPLDGVRETLEKAAGEAPDDDRVWLGLADLAIRTGRFDDAEGWLKRALSKRPRDPVVWRARLNWALAADRIEELARVAPHVPLERVSPSELLAIRARLARRRGDAESEQMLLSALLDDEPGDSVVVERLIDLVSRTGQRERVDELRRQKNQLDQANERYRKLISVPDPSPHFAELARAAESLGLKFESKAWWTLRARQVRDDPDAFAALKRLETPAPEQTSSDETLASPLSDLLVSPGAYHDPVELTTPRTPSFLDRAQAAGLKFTFENGRTPLRQLPETMSGGVGLIDFDRDGWLDVFVVQGGPFPPPSNHSTCGDRLFRNRGDGTFEEATERSGLSKMSGGYGFGVAVGDIDNDGYSDLFVTRWRGYALYRNRGDGTFSDVTEESGLGGPRDWPTSAVLADLDGDGDLDLYVCHYLDWDPDRSAPCRPPGSKENQYCDPRDFVALPDHLFRNDRGKFVDVSADAGITAADKNGRGLGVVAADLDLDGKLDLFVANDTTANYLWHNLGGMHFREEGASAGVAANAEGGYQAGMGIAYGDLDGDGLIDLAVTNFYGESTTFYHNLGSGQFCDRSAAIGLGRLTRAMLGFGIAFLDANNDGILDIASANGHVSDFRPASAYAMPAQLLLGTESGRVINVEGLPWSQPRVGRGLVVGDVDNNGCVDVLIVSQDAPLALFQNTTAVDSHFVTLGLEALATHREAIGAKVTLVAGGKPRVAWKVAGGSYLSASDGRLHFGLGRLRKIERLEVTWPSGRVDRFENLATDTGYLLTEGDDVPVPLPGFRK